MFKLQKPPAAVVIMTGGYFLKCGLAGTSHTKMQNTFLSCQDEPTQGQRSFVF